MPHRYLPKYPRRAFLHTHTQTHTRTRTHLQAHSHTLLQAFYVIVILCNKENISVVQNDLIPSGLKSGAVNQTAAGLNRWSLGTQ